MAIPVLSIIKALGPIVANAAASFAGMRQSSGGLKTEERVRKLEEEGLKLSEGLVGLAEQAQALAEALRVQTLRLEAQEKKTRICLGLSLLVLGAAGTALIFALNQ